MTVQEKHASNILAFQNAAQGDGFCLNSLAALTEPIQSQWLGAAENNREWWAASGILSMVRRRCTTQDFYNYDSSAGCPRVRFLSCLTWSLVRHGILQMHGEAENKKILWWCATVSENQQYSRHPREQEITSFKNKKTNKSLQLKIDIYKSREDIFTGPQNVSLGWLVRVFSVRDST